MRLRDRERERRERKLDGVSDDLMKIGLIFCSLPGPDNIRSTEKKQIFPHLETDCTKSDIPTS
jgi:hypothetical protein